jgi:hypothetical protein
MRGWAKFVWLFEDGVFGWGRIGSGCVVAAERGVKEVGAEEELALGS